MQLPLYTCTWTYSTGTCSSVGDCCCNLTHSQKKGHIVNFSTQLTRWITSSIAVAGCAEPVLIPTTASIDKRLTQHGAGVVVVAWEQGVTRTSLWWEAADVQTSSTGARYSTTAGTCTVGVRGKCIQCQT